MQTRRLLTFVYLCVLIALASQFVHAEVNVTALNTTPGLITQGNSTNITVNVSVNESTDKVFAQITRSNGSTFNVTMTPLTAFANLTIYNYTLLVTHQEPAKNWTIRIIANASGTGSPINDTENTNLTIIDVARPSVTVIVPPSQAFNQGGAIGINVTFTDETATDNLTIQIRKSNGTIFNATMTKLTAVIWNYTITTTSGDAPGGWNLTFFGNDTSNNLNNTATFNISVLDVTSPRVINLSPTTGSQFSVGSNVSVSVNVTDNFAVENVRANITFPNGSFLAFTLFNNSGNIDIWNNTFVFTNQSGNYTIQILANDTVGNVNVTVVSFVIVNSSVGPNVTNLALSNNSFTVQGQTILINVTVNTVNNLDKVFINVTLPDGTQSTQLQATFLTGQIYTASFTNTIQQGGYVFRAVVNDTLGQVNGTVFTNATLRVDCNQNVTRSINLSQNILSTHISTPACLALVRNETTVDCNGFVIALGSGSGSAAFNTVGTNVVRGNVIKNCVISGTPSGNIQGINVMNTSHDNTFAGITFNGTDRPIQIGVSSSNNTITNFVYQGAAGGMLILNSSTVLNFTNVSANTVFGAVIQGSGQSITFENATVTFGRLFNFNRNAAVSSVMSFVPGVSVLVNTTFAPELNVSAIIKLHNLNSSVKLLRSAADDGNFVDCPAAICKVISSGNPAVFNVTSFTTYKIASQVSEGSNTTNTTVTNSSVDNSTATNSNVTSSNVSQSNITETQVSNSTVTGSTTTNTTVDNSSVSGSTTAQTTVNSSTVSNSNTSNTSIQNSNVNGSSVQNSTIQNSTVTGSSVNNTQLANSTIASSNTTNSTILGSNTSASTVDNSTVTNSNVSGSSVNGTSLQNSSVSGSNTTQSNVTQSTVTNSTLLTANVTNSNVTTSNVNLTLVQNSSVLSSNTTLSNVTQSVINNSAVNGSNVTGSSINPSVIRGSTILRSTVRNSVVARSFIDPSNVSNSSVTGSEVNDSVLDNVVVDAVIFVRNVTLNASNVNASTLSNSNITTSNITGSNVTSSNVTGSNSTNSNITGSRVSQSFISGSTLLLSRITVSTVIRSFVDPSDVSNSTVINSVVNDSNISNSVVDNSSLTNVTINNSNVNDTFATNYTNINNSFVNASFLDNVTVASANITNVTAINATVRNVVIRNQRVTNERENPSVFDLKSVPILGNQSNVFNLTANVTDDSGIIQVVIFNVSNSTHVVVAQLIATQSHTNQWAANLSTSNVTIPGNYTYKVIANDSVANINNTVNSTFVISDVIGPLVTNVSSSPVIGNQTNVFLISANVTDNLFVSHVIFNISNTTGVVVAQLLGNLSGTNIYNVTFNTSDNLTPGNYTYKIIANDSFGAVNNTVNSTFVINDVVRPNVTAPSSDPILGNQTNTYNLSANVSDNHAVGQVLFNISNSTHVVLAQLIGTLSSPGRYSVNFNTSDNLTPGNYTYKILGNDTSNNQNNTVNSTFVVNDVVAPNVTALSSNPILSNQTNNINLSANVSDNHAVGTVLFNVSNSTHVVLATLVGTLSSPSRYSVIFNTSDNLTAGNYTYKVIANDTSGNLNNTVNSSFILADVVRPNVTGLSSNPVIGNQTNVYNISANVTDNTAVSVVLFNITNQTGVFVTQLIGTLSGPSRFSVLFNTSDNLSPGNYTYLVIANDTSGNLNNTVNLTFTVNDVVKPNVTLLVLNLSIGNQSTPFNITFNISDNHLLTANTTVNVTHPNASVTQHLASPSAPAQRSFVFTPTLATPAGNYTYRILGNDSSGNLNDSVIGTFVIRDFYNTTLIKITQTLNPVNTSGNITFFFNLTNIGTANITKVRYDEQFDPIYNNFTNSSTAMDTTSNILGSLNVSELLDAGSLLNRPMARGDSITFNITFRAMKNHTNTSYVTNFTFNDSNNNTNGVRNITFIEIRTVNATFTGFPNGTNFNTVPDITNVSNASLSNDNATLNWLLNLDASGQDFTTNSRFGIGFVNLNTTAFNPSINTSAFVTIKNVSCALNPQNRISIFTGAFAPTQNQAFLQANGRDCFGAGVCQNITCVGTTATFTVRGFTGFAFGANANLTIGGTGGTDNSSSNFTAIYTNGTNGAAITGGSCNISFNAFNLSMSNFSASGYNATIGNVLAGTYGYNVTCAAPGFTTLFATDNITIGLAPVVGTGIGGSSGSGGGGGGGGAGLARASSSLNYPNGGPTAFQNKVTKPAASRSYTAFDLIDIIKGFYTGSRKETAFEIIDIIKEFYTKK